MDRTSRTVAEVLAAIAVVERRVVKCILSSGVGSLQIASSVGDIM